MGWSAALSSFVRAPAPVKGLAVEASLCLAFARIVTLMAPRFYTRWLGNLEPSLGDCATRPVTAADDPATLRAARISHVVERVAQRMPFRAKCLQSAIAARLMLTRRGYAPVVYLGVAAKREHRTDSDRAAHSWVAVSGVIVCGAAEVEACRPVGRFV